MAEGSAKQFGGVPYVGALFDSSNGQPTTHFATAFVVAGKYGNMLMSAAHILNGRSASSIIFAPGYADGQAPHNLWHVHKAYTDSAWQANQGIDDDFCFLKVGADVQGRVGSLNLLTGVHPQTCNVIGYPDGLTSPVQATVQAVWYSPEHQLKFTCDGYPNGTSGSPWIINGNSAYGLLGGYQQGGDTPSVSYSPYFGANVRNLYDSANGAFLLCLAPGQDKARLSKPAADRAKAPHRVIRWKHPLAADRASHQVACAAASRPVGADAIRRSRAPYEVRCRTPFLRRRSR